MCAVGVKTYTPAVVRQLANQLLLCRLLKGPSLFGGINNVFTQTGIEDALFEQAVMIWVVMVFLVRASNLFIPLLLACCSKLFRLCKAIA